MADSCATRRRCGAAACRGCRRRSCGRAPGPFDDVRSVPVDDDDCSEGRDSREDEDDEVGSVEGSEYSWNSDEDNFIDHLDECDSSHLGPSEYWSCRITKAQAKSPRELKIKTTGKTLYGEAV